MSDDMGAVLKAICDEVLADPVDAPSGSTTHCNQAARRVAQAMGCPDFDDPDMVADGMYVVMATGGRWAKESGSAATIHALGGGLAFAAMPSYYLNEKHGHLATIYPVGMQYSGSLKRDVPMIANVGRTMGVVKVSAAFPVALSEPDYFCWS